MTTTFGQYSAKLENGVLSWQQNGGAWTVIDTDVAEARYRADGAGYRIHYLSAPAGWSFPNPSQPTTPFITGNSDSQSSFAANRTGSTQDWTTDAMTWGTPIGASVVTPPATPPAGEMHVIATATDLTGHNIVNLAAGVAPTDAVNVSQLTALNQTLVNAIDAGDLTNANAIAATNVRIDNLPGGITMAQVTAEAQRLVGIAVADEILDDAQKQALVDALIAALEDVDTSILTDVDALQVELASLLPRIVALEAAKVAQDAVNATQTSINSAQAGTNAAVQNALNANAAAIATEAQTNATQNSTLTSHSQAISAINLRLDPIVYKIRGGVCTEAVNGMASQCVQTGIAGPDASYSVTLPSARAHSVGVVYLLMGGKRVQVACGSTSDADGVVSSYTFLNIDADIVFS